MSTGSGPVVVHALTSVHADGIAAVLQPDALSESVPVAGQPTVCRGY